MATGKKSGTRMFGDDTVKTKTGKNWKGWFAVLDKARAAQLKHAQIVRLLAGEHGVQSWWSQCITVEYERARGLREPYQKDGKYSVSVSKTVAVGVAQLYKAATDVERRRKWFPKGSFESTSKTRGKYFRGKWQKDARLEIGFYSKGENKAQISLAVSNLASRQAVETQRKTWKAALEKLQAMVEREA
jgi:hypothetical protein